MGVSLFDEPRFLQTHTPLLRRVRGSEFGDGGGDVLQGGSSLRGGENLDGLQSPVAMVTAQVHGRAHAFLRLHRRQKLQGDESTLVCHVGAAAVQPSA